jgi:hypothetical protein
MIFHKASFFFLQLFAWKKKFIFIMTIFFFLRNQTKIEIINNLVFLVSFYRSYFNHIYYVFKHNQNLISIVLIEKKYRKKSFTKNELNE